jgi:hypothetical protein
MNDKVEFYEKRLSYSDVLSLTRADSFDCKQCTFPAAVVPTGDAHESGKGQPAMSSEVFPNSNSD